MVHFGPDITMRKAAGLVDKYFRSVDWIRMRVWRNAKVKAQRLACTAELCISAHAFVGFSTQTQQVSKLPQRSRHTTQGFMRPLVLVAIATGLKFGNKTPSHTVSAMIGCAPRTDTARGRCRAGTAAARVHHASGEN